jgi:type IV pilus assembly protein PilE
MQVHSSVRASTGFTLIELMVVTAIVTILLSIAIPSYQSQVRQSRRTEAKTALLDLAGREERFLSTNPQGYTNVATSLGYGAFPAQVGGNYYTITVACVAAVGAALACDPNANAPVGPAYYLTATPVAGTSQANDTQCTSFSVDSTGAQFAFNSAGANNAAYCWQN